MDHQVSLTESPVAAPEWIARRQEVRAAEWALHHELIAAARTALANFQDNAHKISVQDITRLIELASRLGRLACGMEAGQLDPATPAVRIEIAAALKRVYGQPIEVIAEQVKAPALPPAHPGDASPSLSPL
jgi:hypothetical protein